MTPAEIRVLKFRTVTGSGYRPAEVDALLERVAIQVEAGQAPDSLIERTHLATSFSGYRTGDVDRILDSLKRSSPDPSRDRPEEFSWSNRKARYWGLGLLWLAGVANLFELLSPDRGLRFQILTLILFAVDISLVTRLAIGFSVKATPKGVRVRSLFRTRGYRWEEIRRFGAVESFVGLGGRPRKVLAASLSNGETVRFKALHDRSKVTGWVDDEARGLNRFLAPD